MMLTVDDMSQTMIIRTCALDSGTFTADTGRCAIMHKLVGFIGQKRE